MPGIHSRRSDHPYLVNGLPHLPTDLRRLAEQTSIAGEPIETIFVIPEQSSSKLWGRTDFRPMPEMALVFSARGVLYIQSPLSSRQAGQAIYLRLDQLLYTRLTLVLLCSQLELCGVEGGVRKRIVIEYNTIGHDLLQPALQHLHQMAWGKPLTSALTSDDRTEALLKLLGQQSTKFRNGLCNYALMPGERLSGFVFQPRIYKRLLGIFPRLVAPAALFASTENEILLIEEGDEDSTSYGWTITFFPICYVKGIEVKSDIEWQNACIYLEKEGAMALHEVKFGNAAAMSCLSLWMKIKRQD